MVIDKGAKDLDIEECKEKCRRFIAAGYNSRFISEEVRVGYLTKWGILKSETTLSEKMLKVRDEVIKSFKTMKDNGGR